MSGISMSSSDESIDSRGTIQNPAEEPKNLSNLHLQTDKSIDQFKANDVGYEPSPDTFSTDNDVECYPNGTDLHSDDGEQISYPPPADFGNLSPISRPSQDDLLNRTMNTVESSQSSLRRFTQDESERSPIDPMTTPSAFFGKCVDEHVGGGPPSSVSVGHGIFNGQSDSPRFIAKTVTSRQDYLIASPAMDRLLGQSRAPLRSQSYIAASPHLTREVTSSTKAQQAQHLNPSHLASPKPDKRKLQEKGQTKSTKRKIVSDRIVVLPPMIFQDGPSVKPIPSSQMQLETEERVSSKIITDSQISQLYSSKKENVFSPSNILRPVAPKQQRNAPATGIPSTSLPMNSQQFDRSSNWSRRKNNIVVGYHSPDCRNPARQLDGSLLDSIGHESLFPKSSMTGDKWTATGYDAAKVSPSVNRNLRVPGSSVQPSRNLVEGKSKIVSDRKVCVLPPKPF